VTNIHLKEVVHSKICAKKREVLLAFPEKEAPLGGVDILAGLVRSTF